MKEVQYWPMGFRVFYLREIWAELAKRAAGRPIAIYGAGRHTLGLLDIVHTGADSPRIAVILDDSPSGRKEIRGIPVRTPREVDPKGVALVVASSDTVEATLADRAAAWAGSPDAVVRLYSGEFEPAMRVHLNRSKGVWGTTLQDRNGHLPMRPDDVILRLPRLPERTATSPLPLPPPELRAGYSPIDDDAYLHSGARDVASIRAFMQRHAPDAADPMRILDWGCSSGRMLRHFADVAQRGGEVWGCDLCATAMNWASENLSPPLRFFQSTTRPSLPLPDASMDLIYGNSVFTHIRELFDTWLMELRRVVRPGGLVFTTILDEVAWERCRASAENPVRKRCATLDFSEPMKDDFVCYGGAFDPVTFWHTEGVRRRWSFAFEVLAIQEGVVPYQTGVLLRRA